MPLDRTIITLTWPVVAEKVLRTLMRTTDILVAGFLSPAAVAAVGLADLYSRLPLNVGVGLGGGAIALSSQDSGSGASRNRDEAITQALLLGALAGIPFMLFGFFFAGPAIAVLGATSEVVQLGATYLVIILATSPARHLSLIGARCFQGTGDTRTPMYVNIVSNALNIAGTLVLAFGLGPFPRLEVAGIALATAFGDLFSAGAFLLALRSSRTAAGFARPTNWRITQQLVHLSTPRVLQGLGEMAAEFPLNAILLRFGTEINAAYQIGRRVYQQLTGPVSRGFEVAASVLVGQALGQRNLEGAYARGMGTATLGLSSVSVMAILLLLGATPFALLFTRDPETVSYAVGFIRAFALAAPFTALFCIFSGALRGASETRSALVGRASGNFFFLLGVSYLGGLQLGYGVQAVYVALVLDYVCSTSVVAVVFYARGWMGRVIDMMNQRGSLASPTRSSD